MELSIVIPAYNEESGIASNLNKVNKYLDGINLSSEIIVIDDKSSDTTLPILHKLKEKYPRLKILENNKNRGKGYSVKRGMLAAGGKYLLFSDADLSTPIKETCKFLDAIKDYDIVIGSRRIVGSEIIVKQPWYRIILGDIFSVLVHIFMIKGIKDTQCGFKMFKKSAARKIFAQLTRRQFSFDIEILFLASLFKYKVKEIPIKWINSNKSTVNPIEDSIKMLMDIAIIRFNHIRGVYKK